MRIASPACPGEQIMASATLFVCNYLEEVNLYIPREHGRHISEDASLWK
jgi:hypothetical protein